MKTTIEIPTTLQKENAFNEFVGFMEKHRDHMPSYRNYKFGHSHDGITLTPTTSNHFLSEELAVVTAFCQVSGYSWSVYVEIGGATAPSIEINICKD